MRRGMQKGVWSWFSRSCDEYRINYVHKGALHNYVTPKSAVFYPPTHPVTHSNARPDTRVTIGLDPPTHLRALRNYAMSPNPSLTRYLVCNGYQLLVNPVDKVMWLNWLYFFIMPADTNETVAEHSARLHPSINLHAPATAFKFSCAGTQCAAPVGWRLCAVIEAS